MLMQENDADVKPFGVGNGSSSVAVGDAAKKRELDVSDEKVFHCLQLL